MSNDVDESLLLEMLDWGPPRTVPVRGKGSMQLRICTELGRDFWNLWRDYKDDIRALGVSVGKNEEDEFQAKWWQPLVDAELAGEVDPMPQGTPSRARPSSALVHSVLPGEWTLAECQDILRPYQVPAAATILTAFAACRFVLDASETGLGKTYVACAVAKNMGIPVGVVCPANVVSKWTDTLMDVFEIEPEFVLSYDRLRIKSNDYVTRKDTVRRGKDFTTYSWNTQDSVLIIFDEVHVCSGYGSLNSELLHAALIDPNVYALGVSATVANSPLSMKDIGFGLGLHRRNNWWDWCLAVGCRPGPFGGLTFTAKEGTRGESKLKDIHARIFPSRGCRLRRAELADQLPKNEIIVEVVDTEKTGCEVAVRQALELVDAKEVEDGRRAKEKKQDVSALTENTRDRQRSELLKLGWIFDKTTELVAEGFSVPVFLNFSESIAVMEAWLGKANVRFRKLVGGLRQDADFQANLAPVLLAQTDAGAASIDLHDVHGGHPRASIISPGYSATKLIQALGRIDRNGAKTDCLQFVVFSNEPVEKRAAKLVQAKLNNLALLNDGDLSGAVNVL